MNDRTFAALRKDFWKRALRGTLVVIFGVIYMMIMTGYATETYSPGIGSFVVIATGWIIFCASLLYAMLQLQQCSDIRRHIREYEDEVDSRDENIRYNEIPSHNIF